MRSNEPITSNVRQDPDTTASLAFQGEKARNTSKNDLRGLFFSGAVLNEGSGLVKVRSTPRKTASTTPNIGQS